MEFDMKSAFENDTNIEKGVMTTQPFDMESAFAEPETPDDKKVGGMTKFLRFVFQNNPWEMVGTAVEQAKEQSGIQEGDSFEVKERKIKEKNERQQARRDRVWGGDSSVTETEMLRDNRVRKALDFREEQIKEMGAIRQVQAPMTGAVALAAWEAPLVTALIVGGFSIKEATLGNGKEFMDKHYPDANPNLRDAIEIGEFLISGLGFGAIAGRAVPKGFKVPLPKLKEAFKLSFKNAKAAKMEAKELNIILTDSSTTAKQKKGLLDDLHVKYEQADLAVKTNTSVMVAMEDVIKAAEKTENKVALDSLKEKTKEPNKVVDTVKQASEKPSDKMLFDTKNRAELEQLLDINVEQKLITKTEANNHLAKYDDMVGLEKALEVKPKETKVEVEKAPVTEEVKTTPAPEETTGVIKEVDVGKIKKTKRTKKPTGDSETKTRGLSQTVEDIAIQEGLVKELKDLPQYDTRNMKNDAKNAIDYFPKDPQNAMEIAMGRQQVPKGEDFLPETMFMYLRNQARRNGDAVVLQELAQSGLAGELTTMGQRMRTLAEADPLDPVSAMQQIQKGREKKLMKKRGTKKQIKEDVKSMKESIKKEQPKLSDWESFIKGLEC